MIAGLQMFNFKLKCRFLSGHKQEDQITVPRLFTDFLNQPIAICKENAH